MIKNIIFDFGGVILNIDYNLAMQSFLRLGIENDFSFYSQSKQVSLFDELEKGIITPDEFRHRIKSLSSKTLTDEQIDSAWNSMILELPPERIILLEKANKNYRTFMLSNSNSIHYDVYVKNLRDKYGYKSFAGLLEKVYFSHQVKMKKPDREIFELVINENKLNPEETLFIDDTFRHIEAATQYGLKTHYLTSKETITDLFDDDGRLKRMDQ